MTVYSIVAFDGTPVKGGAGLRSAIIDSGDDDCLMTTDGRRLRKESLPSLIKRGLVTPVEPPLSIQSTSGVLVYRSLPPPNFHVSSGSISWTDCDEFQIAYTSHFEAEVALNEHARVMCLHALAALRVGDRWGATRYARYGLMSVQNTKDSAIAADLYAIAIAAQNEEGDIVEHEARLMLSQEKCEDALRRSIALRGDVERALGNAHAAQLQSNLRAAQHSRSNTPYLAVREIQHPTGMALLSVHYCAQLPKNIPESSLHDIIESHFGVRGRWLRPRIEYYRNVLNLNVADREKLADPRNFFDIFRTSLGDGLWAEKTRNKMQKSPILHSWPLGFTDEPWRELTYVATPVSDGRALMSLLDIVRERLAAAISLIAEPLYVDLQHSCFMVFQSEREMGERGRRDLMLAFGDIHLRVPPAKKYQNDDGMFKLVARQEIGGTSIEWERESYANLRARFRREIRSRAQVSDELSQAFKDSPEILYSRMLTLLFSPGEELIKLMGGACILDEVGEVLWSTSEILFPPKYRHTPTPTPPPP